MNDGRKRQGQKHQNKTVFKIQFNPLALETHKKISYKGLCKRCADQISWKVQYNKYKKMGEPGRCFYCHEKNVSRTYMRACEICYEKEKVCPKCLDMESAEQTEVKMNELQKKKLDQQIQRKMNEFQKTLKERSRRTIKRLHEKGTIEWDNQLNTFVDEEGQPLVLHYRHGYGNNKEGENDEDEDIDEFGEELDSDDEHDHEDEKQKSADNKKKSNNKDDKPKQKESKAKPTKNQKKNSDENENEGQISDDEHQQNGEGQIEEKNGLLNDGDDEDWEDQQQEQKQNQKAPSK